jgi:sulfite reductase (NADPH) flavoprotein alpha-component
MSHTHNTIRPRITAHIAENRRLTACGVQPVVHHVRFEFPAGALDFEPGDVLGVRPRNAPDAVDEVLAACRYSEDTRVETIHGGCNSLRHVLSHDVALRPLTEAMLNASGVHFADESARSAYLPGRELVDLLIDHPCCFASAQAMVSALPRLVGRLFVIANDRDNNPGEAHIVVERTQYPAHGRLRNGTATRFLCDSTPGERVVVFVHKHNHFRLPADVERPIIMFGPGTGIAPFRAFLQQRTRAGRHSPAWLITDAAAGDGPLYQDEWQQHHAAGALSELSVVNGDVRTWIAAHATRWMSLFEQAAVLFACGKAGAWLNDLEAALQNMFSTQQPAHSAAAQLGLAAMSAEGRYLKDVY